MSVAGIKNALSSVPEPFRSELLEHFEVAQLGAAMRDWEKVGLRAGKFSETAYCILLGHCTGAYPAAVSKPRDMQAACRNLEAETRTGASRSARIQIPRVLAAVYELRNNRSIGHAGGDVRPNQMDGLFFDQSLKWIICELIRLYAQMSLSEATVLVESVSTRWTPAVWEREGKKRIILDDISITDKILALLHFSEGRASLADLKNWTEFGNITYLRDRHVMKLHQENMVDYDILEKVVRILPKGSRRVEETILPSSIR